MCSLPTLPVTINLPPSTIPDGAKSPTLFFIHGWPDTSELWDDLVSHHNALGYKCVRVTMPLYSSSDFAFCGRYSCLGYNFSALADMLAAAVREGGGSEDDPVHLVTHDWGSAYGFYLMAKHPKLVKSVVTMDIGVLNAGILGPVDSQTIRNLNFFGRKYQFFVIFIWLMSIIPVVGHVWRFLFWTLYCYKHGGTTKSGDILPSSCYSYWYFQTNARLERFIRWITFGKAGYWGYPDWMHSVDLNSFPPVPTLFLFGKKKDFMFHDDEWAAGLERRGDGSNAVGFECGHWLMREEKDATKRSMAEFYEKIGLELSEIEIKLK